MTTSKILNKYIPVGYIEGYRVFHELDVIKMLAEIDKHKISLAEPEWTDPAELITDYVMD